MSSSFLLYIDAIPTDVLTNKSVHPSEWLIEDGIEKHSFKTKNESEKEHIIQNYYKFMMYRNPVERLVSAYMSKILSHPLIGLEESQPERNWLKLEIYQTTHPGLFLDWVQQGANTPVTISFVDFINYYIETGGIRRDEHFVTVFELCSPCRVRYSYYGNFNTFGRDVGVFSERIGGNSSLLLDAEHQDSGPTSNIAPKFYKLLSHQQKTKIIDILATDLYLYYSLFPAEIGSHKTIMGVDYELPEMQ